jgi:hypothetical protein
MSRRQEVAADKKISVSINLEAWIWELAAQIESNRSKFFRELLVEEIKAELISQKVMTEDDTVSELLGDVFLSIKQYNQQLRTGRMQRKPIRSGGTSYDKVPDSMKKRAISINMENWLWELAEKAAPNRSAYFKDLFLKKVKSDLIREGLVEKDAVITKEHADMYLHKLLRQKQKVS